MAVQAQPITAKSADANAPNAGLKLVEVAALHGVNPSIELPDVLAGRAGNFVRQNGLHISDTSWEEADVWLRLTLQGIALQDQPASAIQVLEFPKPYLNDIRLYSPPLAGEQAWRMQAAGDGIAQKDWLLRGLYPRFLLPSAQEVLASPEGKQVLYVRIKHNVPMMVKAQIISAGQAIEDAQMSFLALGLTLGAILLTALLTLSSSIANKDSIFGWYSAYALAAALATASHSGIAHLMLWPVSGIWPGTAVFFWVLLACSFQLQFCRVLFQPHRLDAWLARAAAGLGLLCLITAFLFAFMQAQWKFFYFVSLGLIFLNILISMPLVYLTWRQGNQLALAWMIAFIPLFATVGWSLLDGIGLLPTGMNHNTPIYAAALEVILLGLALQLFARERHGQMEREKALEATDPLTGFATKDAFQSRLQRDWQAQARPNQDLAVAYIELITRASDSKQSANLLKRSIRVLRSATQAQDMVARLDGPLMAVLMQHTHMGDDLSQRLSRIIALGLMPERSDPQAGVLQFRIAATTRQAFNQPLAELDTQLRDLLAQTGGWGSKPIRYVGGGAPKRYVRHGSPLPDLDEVWQRALLQEQKDAQVSIQR